jgi:prophage antirepressor-like protein
MFDNRINIGYINPNAPHWAGRFSSLENGEAQTASFDAVFLCLQHCNIVMVGRAGASKDALVSFVIQSTNLVRPIAYCLVAFGDGFNPKTKETIMSNLSVLSFKNHSIRTIENNGLLWAVASDVAKALDYKNPHQALASHVDLEDVQKLDTLTNGGKQKLTCINESGIYALTFGSTKPEAKEFKRWVTSEVLPSIRKNDNYGYINTRHGQHAPAGLFSGLDNGRYLLVATKGEVILRDIAGCNIVKADSVRKIQQDLRTLADANLAMQQRLSVLTGDASSKVLDAPLNIGIGWELC